MRREAELTRPAWWPDWFPDGCPGCGRELLPGKVTVSWTHCDCPGAGEARGHHRLFCTWDAVRWVPRPCRWWRWPPEHVAGWETVDRAAQL